eukprot:Hpha_TRINITY_DN16794_c6_g2::TRINITY_DN16794_c6_g2_i10::g.78983::m.78983
MPFRYVLGPQRKTENPDGESVLYPEYIVADGECAIWKSVEKYMPWVQLVACLWHLRQHARHALTALTAEDKKDVMHKLSVLMASPDERYYVGIWACLDDYLRRRSRLRWVRQDVLNLYFPKDGNSYVGATPTEWPTDNQHRESFFSAFVEYTRDYLVNLKVQGHVLLRNFLYEDELLRGMACPEGMLAKVSRTFTGGWDEERSPEFWTSRRQVRIRARPVLFAPRTVLRSARFGVHWRSSVVFFARRTLGEASFESVPTPGPPSAASSVAPPFSGTRRGSKCGSCSPPSARNSPARPYTCSSCTVTAVWRATSRRTRPRLWAPNSRRPTPRSTSGPPSWR